MTKRKQGCSFGWSLVGNLSQVLSVLHPARAIALLARAIAHQARAQMYTLIARHILSTQQSGRLTETTQGLIFCAQFS